MALGDTGGEVVFGATNKSGFKAARSLTGRGETTGEANGEEIDALLEGVEASSSEVLSSCGARNNSRIPLIVRKEEQ
jgi:hypothetical protein